MNLHSRGRLDARIGHNPFPRPLTDRQKNVIEAWARRGRRDRETAEHLGIGEGRVTAYRVKLGIKGTSNRGVHQDSYAAKNLRPSHVRGEAGSDEWFASNERGFQSAVIAAGGW